MTANMREALEVAREWLSDLQHMGSIVDQEALAGDLAKIDAALSAVPAPVSEDLENHVALPVANESAVPQHLQDEIAKAWGALEDYGFPPEACGFPFVCIEGQLPNAIACALECLIEQRNQATKAVEEITSLEAAPSQRGSPNPVSEEEIARAIFEAVKAEAIEMGATTPNAEWSDTTKDAEDGRRLFRAAARAILSRLSRTEGEWRLDPKTVEMCAQYHDQSAKDCEAIAKVNQDNDLGADCLTRAADHRVDAMELRSLCQLPDPEEPVRKMLDDQHVKSSGGVRTSTGKE